MKILTTLFVAIFIGCSASNWNLGNNSPVIKKDNQNISQQQNSTSQSQTVPGDIISVEKDINEPIEDIQVVDNGVLNESNSTIDDKSDDKYEKVQQESAIIDKEDSNGNKHISAVIAAWGEPKFKTSDGVYIWESCRKSGKYVKNCEDNECQAVAQEVCCDRKLKTNQNGYVTNLREALKECN